VFRRMPSPGRGRRSRVETLASSSHVVVSSGGVVLADSTRSVLLLEPGHPVRHYIPRADVDVDALSRSPRWTVCASKGVADQHWRLAGQPSSTPVAWSYSRPLPAVARIADLIAFRDEVVDVTVDGVRQDRPGPAATARSRSAARSR
jgi:uncharacterized protein (DUF427 family)